MLYILVVITHAPFDTVVQVSHALSGASLCIAAHSHTVKHVSMESLLKFREFIKCAALTIT
jgi:hypothetical protein